MVGVTNTITNLPQTLLPTEWTLADLQQHVGGVPLERIRLYPPPGMATEQDALEIAAREDRLYELVDGILVEKSVGSYESLLATILIYFLHDFLKTNPLGVVLGPDGQLWILPGKMRMPDVSFIRWERFPNRKLPRDRVFRVAPDLAVEILSEGNTASEMTKKLREYFEAGVRLVWYIDPKAHVVIVHTAPDQSQELHEDDVLDGSDVLPDFRLLLRDLFDRYERDSGNVPAVG